MSERRILKSAPRSSQRRGLSRVDHLRDQPNLGVDLQRLLTELRYQTTLSNTHKQAAGMLAHRATTLIINPREYQVPEYNPVAKRSVQANLIDPSIASTKEPVPAPPPQLYNPDGSINHINHYFYYHHLTHFDKLDGLHRGLFDDDGYEIPHFHHPVSSINLESVAKFGQLGITSRRNKGFRSASSSIHVPKQRRRAAVHGATTPDESSTGSDLNRPYLQRQKRFSLRSPSGKEGEGSSRLFSSGSGFRRYFSFNWRSIWLPHTRQSPSQSRQSSAQSYQSSPQSRAVSAEQPTQQNQPSSSNLQPEDFNQTVASRQSLATELSQSSRDQTFTSAVISQLQDLLLEPTRDPTNTAAVVNQILERHAFTERLVVDPEQGWRVAYDTGPQSADSAGGAPTTDTPGRSLGRC
ncbi:hypothetical protein BZA70DRAFT_44286 [Myxozyma melibiosi]|uniref:Uncharacterized protein n=1 Tax=Myxozyma melibiosi TaxID=54550 RepID=A0ABR1FEL3_9ASCO